MKPKFLFSSFLAVFVSSTRLVAAAETNQIPTQSSIPYLSPAEEAKTFVLPKGYRMELVVSDPIIREPVVTVFDGDGRMFIAEMRTYMQDIDGKNEHTNAGCVSLHWSSKRNGVYDKHTIFADHLLLPRMILPVADGLLINETDSNDLWLYRDKDGDGISDSKTRIYEGGTRGGNLEHQQSGLIWNLDNWLYMTVNDCRLRFDGTNIIKEPTPAAGGQWGLSHDDYGKPWFVNAGGEIGPIHFQQPIIYGRFKIKDEMAPDYMEVWPLVGLADVQGGEIRFRTSDKTLNHLTAACGGEIYRGDRLPADMRGDLFFAEPVGRMIRRTEIDVKDGVTVLRNPYEKSEFIRSRDPNFRPVNLATAPDGTLYITDMYRGIIQEGNWVKEGSYLRKVVQQYQMDKNFGRGRIWRLVHDNFKPGPKPKLQTEKPSKLVQYLAHPNGWWRDTAQKLIVLHGDKSVVPALLKMARTNKDHLARIHALWTLEGLGAIDATFLREKLRDEHPQVRIAAIRASETLCKKGDTSLIPDMQALAQDRDPGVVIQIMMTANFLHWKDAKTFVEKTMKGNGSRGVQEIGNQLMVPAAAEGKEFSHVEKMLLRQGENIYNELCFTCHGQDGKGMPLQGAAAGVTMAPPLSWSRTVTGLRDGSINVLLKGLSGPVNNKKYDAQMVSMESNSDEWIAAIASYVRNNFSNDASMVRSNDVAQVRATYKERTQPWTLDELRGVLPQALTNRASWKVTANYNSNTNEVAKAIDGKSETRYTTGKEQVPGMWFQIELPEPTEVSGLLLDASSSNNDFPRAFKVDVSDDGKKWGRSVATGHGNSRTTEISFPPTKTKFIRIMQTSTAKGLFWSIHELQVYQPPDPEKVKVAQTKKAEASKFE
ncbi:MAG: coagulation factor 5/8 type domain protein [Verrucomicrobiales bacterium]|nr:coagulation factor 5/8 type domain protein [Verrucomicrobiales bacterium]